MNCYFVTNAGDGFAETKAEKNSDRIASEVNSARVLGDGWFFL
jgi:hypothetical protein